MDDSLLPPDMPTMMAEEMNRRLQREQQKEYTLVMTFDDQLLMVRNSKGDGLEQLYQMITDRLVAKLREEGYPDGSYRVEFNVQRGMDGFTSKLYARARVDERKKGLTGWTVADPKYMRNSIMNGYIGLDMGRQADKAIRVEEPKGVADNTLPEVVIDGTMEQTLKLRRAIKITEV